MKGQLSLCRTIVLLLAHRVCEAIYRLNALSQSQLISRRTEREGYLSALG